MAGTSQSPKLVHVKNDRAVVEGAVIAAAGAEEDIEVEAVVVVIVGAVAVAAGSAEEIAGIVVRDTNPRTIKIGWFSVRRSGHAPPRSFL
jgi:hypothetical protein